MRVRNRRRGGGWSPGSTGTGNAAAGNAAAGNPRTLLVPADLVYDLCRRVESLQLSLPDCTVLPLRVEIRIAPADLTILAPVEHRLTGALAAHMCKHARSRGWFVQAWPKVRFVADSTVVSGDPQLDARYYGGQTAEEASWSAAFWAVVGPLRCADGLPSETGPDPRPAAWQALRVRLPTPRRGQC